MKPEVAGLLKGAFALGDALRNIAIDGPVTVHLSRNDGLKLLSAVSGADGEAAEIQMGSKLDIAAGYKSLDVAGIAFQWPRKRLAAKEPVVRTLHRLIVSSGIVNSSDHKPTG